MNPSAVRRRNKLLLTAGLVACLAVGIAAVWNLLSIQRGYAASQEEYARLREYAPKTEASVDVTEVSETSVIPVLSAGPESKPDLFSINPDYIGWIRIEGTGIGYPVVRGADNTKYLSTSFSGEKNPSGTIYMDSGCKEGFDEPFCVLYGHNMRDGSMFAALNRYLEVGYLAEHPEIIIVTPDGETQAYRVFKVKLTNTRDAAYTLAGKDRQAIIEYLVILGETEGEKIIMLSTCTNNSDQNERLLIFAAKG